MKFLEECKSETAEVVCCSPPLCGPVKMMTIETTEDAEALKGSPHHHPGLKEETSDETAKDSAVEDAVVSEGTVEWMDSLLSIATIETSCKYCLSAVDVDGCTVA